jgi:hypothetical protein
MKDNYKIRVPKQGAFTIKTEDDFIQLHAVILAVAKRGVGKSTSFGNLLRLMKDNNSLDRLILVSPTYHNNKQNFIGLPLEEEDVIEPEKNTPEVLMEILEAEGVDYDLYWERIKKWKLLQKLLRSKTPIDEIDPFLLLEFGDDETNFRPPTHKYNGKKPVIVIFFDDCQGSDLFKSSSKISKLVIAHRHWGKIEDGALGCTLLFATQSYTSSSMGLPKSIRTNLTHMMVFKNKNINELKAISVECAGEVDEEAFYKLYDRAILEPHDFLFIDFAKKKCHPSMFRRNFDQWLIVEDKTKDKENNTGKELP